MASRPWGFEVSYTLATFRGVPRNGLWGWGVLMVRKRCGYSHDRHSVRIFTKMTTNFGFMGVGGYDPHMIPRALWLRPSPNALQIKTLGKIT